MDLIDLYELLLQHGLERGEKTANLARGIWMAFHESPSQLTRKIPKLEEPLKLVVDNDEGRGVPEAAKEAIRKEWRAGGVSKNQLASNYGMAWGTVSKIVEGIKQRKTR